MTHLIGFLTACLAGACLLLLALVGCTVDPPISDQQDLTSSTYALTQTIHNNSTLDMTVMSALADNGGTVVPGAPSVIAAGTSGTFMATNVGNGVQLKVTLAGPAGQVLLVDSDVPRVDANWSTATLSGTAGGLSTGAIAIGEHDQPSADFTLESCAPDTNCITSTTTRPVPTVKATP